MALAEWTCTHYKIPIHEYDAEAYQRVQVLHDSLYTLKHICDEHDIEFADVFEFLVRSRMSGDYLMIRGVSKSILERIVPKIIKCGKDHCGIEFSTLDLVWVDDKPGEYPVMDDIDPYFLLVDIFQERLIIIDKKYKCDIYNALSEFHIDINDVHTIDYYERGKDPNPVICESDSDMWNISYHCLLEKDDRNRSVNRDFNLMQHRSILVDPEYGKD